MSFFPQNIFFFLSTTEAMNEYWLYTDLYIYIARYIYFNTDIDFFFYNYFFSNCPIREMKQSISRAILRVIFEKGPFLVSPAIFSLIDLELTRRGNLQN